jgi:MtN3 and saliva related transmembrane protein
METATVLGTAAGTLTTLALVPQVVRILRTRSARDVSGWAYATMGAGVGLWTVYGVVIDSLPVIVFNALTLVLAFAVLALKYRWR